VTPSELPFAEIWLRDFEFVGKDGERPDVVCLAATELRSGKIIQQWRDPFQPHLNEISSKPPYSTGPNSLCVSFVENAECASELSLKWPRARHVLDLSPAFRNIVNGRIVPEGKGLIGACRYYGLPTIGIKKKEAMRARILRGWPFTADERRDIQAYCLDDVRLLAQLLPHILSDPDFNLSVALYHGEFAAVSGVMEHNGVMMNMEIYPELADKQTWRNVRDAMVPSIDAEYGVYVRGASGDWSFNAEKFKAYLERRGIVGWPVTDTGKLDLKEKTFQAMCKGFPELEPLRQLRHTRNKMRKVKLAVGSDGRNRTVLWPFQAKTSRTQPKAAKWIFSPAVWLRNLIRPGRGMAVAYIDYSAMEFMISAVHSDGHLGPRNHMAEMYQSGDPYLSFAKAVGAVPKDATKQSHSAVRDKYKNMLLASLYGLSAASLSARLGVSFYEGNEMLNQHHETFAQYWAWSDDWVQHALQTGVMWTPMGWFCRTGITEFNERSLRNWPVQSTGADILRIACILAVRHGIKLLAPIHDAVLIEAPIERIEADAALMQELMRRASRIVLNKDPAGTFELRTDCKIIRYPDSYSDARGDKVWDDVMRLLADRQATTRRLA
jgi:hypothetical protein